MSVGGRHDARSLEIQLLALLAAIWRLSGSVQGNSTVKQDKGIITIQVLSIYKGIMPEGRTDTLLPCIPLYSIYSITHRAAPELGRSQANNLVT